MDYATIKLIHVSAVILSIAGFMARGLGMLAESAWVSGRVARTLPHVVDTVLLLSAIALAWMLRASPLHTPWIAAKILGLAAYIALGTIALKRGRSKRVRALAGIAAIAVFAYIVSVALTKDPRGFLSALSVGAVCHDRSDIGAAIWFCAASNGTRCAATRLSTATT